MEEQISIASITVAFNGAGVIAPHLAALKRQTRKLDEIIVVNNASTDGTANLLRTQFPEITVLQQSTNGGVGGGYAAGLNYAALNKKYDWVWLFDQDSVPASDALARLLNGLRSLGSDAQKTAVLASLCVDPVSRAACTGLSWRGGRLFATPMVQPCPVIFSDSVISSGSLIRREAIEAAGLPRPDFFMDFVDHEHCFRLRRYGFKIAIVRDSLVEHVLGNPAELKILGFRKHWTDHRPWREYYMVRNEVFTIWQHYPEWRIKGFVLYRLARHALDVMLFGREKLACIKMMCRGFLDGRAAKLGIRFLPESMEGDVFSAQTFQASGVREKQLEEHESN
jgi:GT2 family glycosyltransferase